MMRPPTFLPFRAAQPPSLRAAPFTSYGAVSLQPGSRRVFVGDHPVPVTYGQYVVMEMLVQGQGRPVPRETLHFVAIRRPLHFEDRAIDQFIYQLRRALDAVPGGAGLIGTARGQGWWLSDRSAAAAHAGTSNPQQAEA